MFKHQYKYLYTTFAATAATFFFACSPGFAFLKWGFIDTKGNFVIAPEYESVESFEEDGHAIVVKFNSENPYSKPTVSCKIDKEGEVVATGSPKSFKKLSNVPAPATSERLSPCWIDSKIAFKDNSGKIIIIGPKFKEAKKFSEGLAAVKLNSDKRWKYINKNGEVTFTLPPSYNQVGNFQEGLAAVFRGSRMKKLGFIDKTGKLVIPCKYRGEPDESMFCEGLCKIYDNSRRVGFINKEGKIVIAPQFVEAMNFSNGLAACEISDRSDETFNSQQWKQIGKSDQEFWTRMHYAHLFFKENYVFRMTREQVERQLGPGNEIPGATATKFSGSRDAYEGFFGLRDQSTVGIYIIIGRNPVQRRTWLEIEYGNEKVRRYRYMSIENPGTWITK